ncbi:MAG: protein kinase [Candidatus Pacearchaeota archaeon]
MEISKEALIFLDNGSNGSVFLVKISERFYAVKIQKEENHEHEIEIHSKLTHPSIITFIGNIFIKDIFKTGILMELAEMTLSDIFSSEVKIRFTSKMIKSLVSAINYIHNKGIVHGDLGSHNILLSNGYLKIADFGNAQYTNNFISHINKKRIVQCPPYIAPEIFRGEECNDWTKIDMWSLGIILADIALYSKKKPLLSDLLDCPHHCTYPFCFHVINIAKELGLTIYYSDIENPDHIKWYSNEKRYIYHLYSIRYCEIINNTNVEYIPITFLRKRKAFVSNLLVFDPNRRFNAQQILNLF